MRSEVQYLSLQQPVKTDADSMISCLNDTLRVLGIEKVDSGLGVVNSNKPIIVGGGTDGVSANIGEHNGMKTKLQQQLLQLKLTQYFSHQLGLACKNGMSSQIFEEVVEMVQK